MTPRLLGHIWPRNSAGKQLLIAQVADDGPEIINYTDPRHLFDNMKRLAREVDQPFPWGGLGIARFTITEKTRRACEPRRGAFLGVDAPFPGDK